MGVCLYQFRKRQFAHLSSQADGLNCRTLEVMIILSAFVALRRGADRKCRFSILLDSRIEHGSNRTICWKYVFGFASMRPVHTRCWFINSSGDRIPMRMVLYDDPIELQILSRAPVGTSSVFYIRVSFSLYVRFVCFMTNQAR